MIIPNYCFAANINAVMSVGAKPVIVDVNLKNWTIDTLEIKKNLSSKTKAIIAVHTYGIVCDLKEIKKIIKKKKFLLLKD